MPRHHVCKNPLCAGEFNPRANGRKQEFCKLACRRQYDRLVRKLGKAALDICRPVICAEREAAKRRGGDCRGEVSSPKKEGG